MLRTFRWWLAFVTCVLPGLTQAQTPPQADAGTEDGSPSEADADAEDGSPSSADAGTEGAAGGDGLTPPQLLAFVDAGYPAQAREAQREASVLLLITIGADGFVEDVTQVGEPAGDGFDELAVAAARRFVFEPAKQGGEPIRARIQYRYDFKFQPEPEPQPPAGEIALQVRSLAQDAPLQGVKVVLSRPEDPQFSLALETDETGAASSGSLPPGRYEVGLSKEGFDTERHVEEVREDQRTELTYRLMAHEAEAPGGDAPSFGAVARVKAPPREVTRRTIAREELTRVAGTRGDALRTIELLPGVSRPPFGAGLVLIRGSAPADSQVLLDGVPVPLLYHFGGLTSFINSRALQSIDFYPGNFSARYGRQIGGIIDVELRDPATDGYHGILDTNYPIDTSLLVEGPLGDKASFLVGGRRSYLGEILAATIPEDALGAIATPVYYDYQGILTYRPTGRDRLRLAAYGSGDRIEVLFSDVPDDDPTIRGIEVRSVFHRQQLGWKHRYSARFEHDIQASYGRIENLFGAGRNIRFDLKNDNLYLRGEWKYRASSAVQLMFGTDSSLNRTDVRYLGPRLEADEGDNSGTSTNTREQVFVDAEYTNVSPGIYTEVALEPVPSLRLVPGLRLDYFRVIHKFTFNPRFSAVYEIVEGTRLKGGVGVFSQPPAAQESARVVGNPNLLPIVSVHYGAGVEQDFSHDLSIGVEGFYKRIYDRVVLSETGEPPFVNDGIGRIYGLEVSGRKMISGRWFGFLSYTLMRSERKDRDEPWRLFDYDQTHIFTLAGTVLLGRGWEVGGTVRVVTGNPRTPVIGSAYNEGDDTYVPIYGPINSARSPTFNRLDLRVQKTWKFDAWSLAWYLDIQNTTNAKNIESVTYSYDYSESAEVRGLPIIPAIGLRGQL